MSGHVFSSESVTEGHPDKICDAVSDAVLDALLKQDPNSRVACETMVKTGYAIVAGEVTSKAVVEYPEIIRQTIREIGYTSSDMGFDADTCAVLSAVEQQSPDISLGVTAGEGLHNEQGAGDQRGADLGQVGPAEGRGQVASGQLALLAREGPAAVVEADRLDAVARQEGDVGAGAAADVDGAHGAALAAAHPAHEVAGPVLGTGAAA